MASRTVSLLRAQAPVLRSRVGALRPRVCARWMGQAAVDTEPELQQQHDRFVERQEQMGTPPFWTGTDRPSQKVQDLADQFLDLNVFEMTDFADLVRVLMRSKSDFPDPRSMGLLYGLPATVGPGGLITPQQGQPQAGGAQAGGAQAAEKEEKKPADKETFDIKLEGFEASKKVHVIKEVRAFTKLGIKEAKELVEKAPVVIMKDVKKDEVDAMLKKLQEVGANVAKE